MTFNEFSILSSDGHFVGQSEIVYYIYIYAILVEGLMRKEHLCEITFEFEPAVQEMSVVYRHFLF